MEIWQAEAAFNSHLDEWRVWWDEWDYADNTNELWTAVVDWDSNISDVSFFITGNPGMKSLEDDEDESSSGGVIDATGDGCKRFFVSYDPSQYNSGHRYLMSGAGGRLMMIGSDGSLLDERVNDNFPYPLTGVCNTSWCSYQEIGRVGVYPNFQLTHRRFTEYFNSTCDPPNETITPVVAHPYPLAMAVNDNAALVVYSEDTPPYGDNWHDLYLTVLDN